MNASAELERHLRAELRGAARRDTFDMSDAPEIARADCHPQLQDALRILQSTVGREWDAADREALRFQKWHRRFARIAITVGTASIVLAIAQLAGLEVGFLELIAVGAALLAVVMGLLARTNWRWLGHRHRAERLRMLKFRAVGKLLCEEEEHFKAWLSAELQDLPAATDFARVEAWEQEGRVEPASPAPPRTALDPELAEAVISYYLFKRVAYQDAYFERRHLEYEKEARVWRRLSFPLFLGSVLCVIGHFVLEWIAHKVADPEIRHGLEQTAAAFTAMAAILPVLAAGVRAWLAAFERPRSASLFGAKHHALQRAAQQLEQDRGDIALTLRHISEIEHFLENEHREWLRLLRDTEWYL